MQAAALRHELGNRVARKESVGKKVAGLAMLKCCCGGVVVVVVVMLLFGEIGGQLFLLSQRRLGCVKRTPRPTGWSAWL